MDLSSMLNDGPVAPLPLKKPSLPTSPGLQRHSTHAPSVPPTPGAGTSYPSSAQSTPLYAPPAARRTPGTGMTALHTPGQSAYPFPSPSHPSQSPVGPPYSASHQQQQQYAYSATTPTAGSRGGAPNAYGYPPPQQPSPGHYTQQPPTLQHHSSSSQSSTPSTHYNSAHSQHLRQSPLSTISQPPLQHQQSYPSYPPSAHPTSQPNTPLGPPSSHPYARTSQPQHPYSNHEAPSPYGYPPSGPSTNGYHHPHQQQQSPYAAGPPPPIRRTSDYLSQLDRDRERSLSVSPKTIPPPRPSSMSMSGSGGSRHGSASYQYDSLSARGSVTVQSPAVHSYPPPLQQSTSQHVSGTGPPGASAASGYGSMNGGAGGSSSTASPTTAAAQTLGHPQLHSQPHSQTSMSHTTSQPQPLPQQHQSQKMGMEHLLAPTDPQVTPSIDSSLERESERVTAKPKKSEAAGLFVKKAAPRSAQPVGTSVSTTPPPAVINGSAASHVREAEEEGGSRAKDDLHSSTSTIPSEDRVSHKRPAPDSSSTPEDGPPPAKKGKVRKYPPGDRPIWARLREDNPLCHLQAPHANGAPPPPSSTTKPSSSRTTSSKQRPFNPGSNGAASATGTNGTPVGVRASQPTPTTTTTESGGGGAELEPWQRDPPLDGDLIRARKVLGEWEKSFRWTTPYPDLLKQVQDWLWVQLAGLEDVDTAAGGGAIEIEAKIGQVVSRGGKAGPEGDRVKLPVLNLCVLEPGWNGGVRFESEMAEHEHRALNTYLNNTIQSSLLPGRSKMTYAHPKETDSFLPLSAAGFAALPPAFRKRAVASKHEGKDLKLRTTTSPTGEITARIVKIHIADLHLLNPSGDYDLRVTINLEADFSAHPHPEDLVDAAPTSLPSRKKDRLSYKHLVYSVDLTRVDVVGSQPKYELELEVDAEVLRQQMRRMLGGEEGAFGDVVAGFLDDSVWLMKQRGGQG